MTPGEAGPRALSPRALTVLAYLGGWATGAVVWLLEPDDPRIRFHAAQSVVLFGGLSVLWVLLWAGSFVALTTVGPGVFTALQYLSGGVLIGLLVLWLIALRQAWIGRDWQVPLAGRLARAATSRRSSPQARP